MKKKGKKMHLGAYCKATIILDYKNKPTYILKNLYLEDCFNRSIKYNLNVIINKTIFDYQDFFSMNIIKYLFF